ncbi:MAG: radical SAM protein [Candidatus Omnitrophota bacterium]|jgi:radical SAM superfamily enzyme YgiQ (UPF0313 family)
MRIALVNTNFVEQSTPNFMLNFEAGLLSLGAVLEREGYQTEIVNLFRFVREDKLALDSSFPESAASAIIKRKAAILGFNSRCDTYPVALDIARRCKMRNPGSLIVIGGPQATFTDRETLANFPFVDVIVRGEGEATFLELAGCFKENRGLGGVRGITYRKGKKIIRNPARELIKNLDSLPFPAYPLLGKYMPSSAELKEGWAYIAVGRGCPYNCTFCSTGRMWRRCYRLRSPGKIFEEIDYLKKNYGIKRFYLGHDNFFTSKKDVMEIAGLLLKNKTDIEWTCSSRVDSIDAELLEAAYLSGCRRIFFGVESGSRRMQKIFGKNINPEHALKAIEDCGRFNIYAILSFIMGFPEEKEEDLNATLKLAIKIRIAGNGYPYLRPLTPIAGTEVFLKNRKRLVLRDTWDTLYSIGKLIRSSPWSRGVIEKYPQIFSNFYLIKSRYLPEYLAHEAGVFFSVLICAYPRSLYVVLEKTKLEPLDLMVKFKLWAGSKRLVYRDKTRAPHYRQILLYFPDFLEDFYKGADFSKFPKEIVGYEKRRCNFLHNRIGC